MSGFMANFGDYGYAIILVLFILLVIVGCACC
ncbi:MAG TPA: YjcZ family sporulation protein [Haloplasmataceae bacterium]